MSNDHPNRRRSIVGLVLRADSPRDALGSRRRLHRPGARRPARQGRRARPRGRWTPSPAFRQPARPQEARCFPAKAKSVIFLFMYGGPSQVDTFDYKPELYKLDGKTIPIKTFGRGGKKNEGRVVGPKWKFKQYGESGKYGLRPVPEPGHLRRRHRLPPLDDGRLADPRLGDAPDELHGQDPLGEPVPRLVGQLRPRLASTRTCPASS